MDERTRGRQWIKEVDECFTRLGDAFKEGVSMSYLGKDKKNDIYTRD